MQANTFKEGDRVQLIPFKHKGKVATVRYFGQIGRKFGTWVGLELEVSVKCQFLTLNCVSQ